jgi:septum formation protein
MLRRLSDTRHRVISAVALVVNGQCEVRLNVSHVTFRRLGEEEIAAYVACGEADDKAGAYAIQGRAAVFIVQLVGSYSGVMGLPLYETAGLLALHGISVT